MTFPEFMFRSQNKIPTSQQNRPDIEGYYYTANDGSQMAFWTYKATAFQKSTGTTTMNGCCASRGNILLRLTGKSICSVRGTSFSFRRAACRAVG